MSYIRVDVAIKPSLEAQNQAIHLSKYISTAIETYFVLDNKKFFPHVTIYSTEYPSKNFEKVLEKLEELTKNLSPFPIEFGSISTHQGYVDFQLHKSQEWVNIHEEIVNLLNPFRENHLRDKYTNPDELQKYSKEQQEYIKQYGYAEVFNAFRPHITISRIKDEKRANEIIKNLPGTPFSFTANEIAAYTMGQHGTCTRIIKEFPL